MQRRGVSLEWGSRKDALRPLTVLLISQLRHTSHAALGIMNYFSSGKNHTITHLICCEPIMLIAFHIQASQQLQSDREMQTKDIETVNAVSANQSFLVKGPAGIMGRMLAKYKQWIFWPVNVLGMSPILASSGSCSLPQSNLWFGYFQSRASLKPDLPLVHVLYHSLTFGLAVFSQEPAWSQITVIQYPSVPPELCLQCMCCQVQPCVQLWRSSRACGSPSRQEMERPLCVWFVTDGCAPVHRVSGSSAESEFQKQWRAQPSKDLDSEQMFPSFNKTKSQQVLM